MRTLLMFRLLCLLTLLSPWAASAQILNEDFQAGFLPAGWAVFNGDGLTPNAAVSQITNAWIVAADFDIAGEQVAMSTSWYTTPGASNDWLITPSINLTANNELRWQAEAQDPDFPDGYEVRLTTGAQLPANTTNFNNVLFTVAAEVAGSRASHTVNLQNAGFSNQNVSIAFRNNSFDQFILMVDNIEVRVAQALDATVTSAAQEYTILPFSQSVNIPIQGNVTNLGINTATNTTLKVNIYDGAFNLVRTSTSAAQTLAAGGSGNFSVAAFTPSASDFYTFELVAQLAGDADPSNDTLYYGILVDDSTMARDDGIATNTLGIGANNGGVMGQIFALNTPARLSSVSYFHQPHIGQTYVADVYNWVNNRPGAVIASSLPFFATSDTAVYTTRMLALGSIVLPADTFYIGVREPDSTLRLSITPTIFLPGVTWISWPTNPNGWSSNEDFGFFAVYILRPNFNECAGFNAIATAVNTPCGQDLGSATLSISNGNGLFSYLWSTGDTTNAITGLGPGFYNVTITDALGCTAFASAIVNDINAPVLSTSGTSVNCAGGNDGSAFVNASGGTGPYAYTWSNGGSSANIVNLIAGIYHVTVSDAGGCQSFASVVVNEPSALVPGISTINETCLGCNDGSATVVATGGTTPYAYLWSTGSTAGTINNLAPGAYTVTITDVNGCSVVDVAIIDPIVGLPTAAKLLVQLSPNPNQGQFQLNVLLDAPENIEVTLYDLLGKPVWKDIAPRSTRYQHEFQSGQLPAGQYVVEVKSGQLRSIRRLVIQ
jgi:hypothetical protein